MHKNIFAGNMYYHGAQAVIISYDLTNRKTFENVGNWKQKFEENIPDHDRLTKVLVGCKNDLEENREVSIECEGWRKHS